MSVLRTNYPDFEVVVVDCGSKDGAADLAVDLEKSNRNLKVLRLSRDPGYCQAVNIGVEAAESEYICKLDNDTVVEPNWLTRLVDVVAADREIGAAQSGGYFYDGPLKQFGQWGLDSIGQLQPQHPREDVEEIFFPTGFAFLISKRIFLALGGYYPEFYWWYEEVDLGWRLQLAGYKVVRVGSSIVRHLGPLKGPRRKEISFHEFKNHMSTLLINYNLADIIVSFPRYLAVAMVCGILEMLRGDTWTTKACLKACFWVARNMHLVVSRRLFLNKYLRVISDSQVKRKMVKTRILTGRLIDSYLRLQGLRMVNGKLAVRPLHT